MALSSHPLEFTTAPWVLGGQGIVRYQHVLDPVADIRGWWVPGDITSWRW